MKGRYRRQPCLQQGFCTGADKPSSSKSTHRHLPPAQLGKKSQLILLGSCMKKKVCHTRRGFVSLDRVGPEVTPHLWVVISCISLKNCSFPEITGLMSPWNSLQQPCLFLTVPPWWWPNLLPKWDSRCHGDTLTWIHNKISASQKLFVQAVCVLLCRWEMAAGSCSATSHPGWLWFGCPALQAHPSLLLPAVLQKHFGSFGTAQSHSN